MSDIVERLRYFGSQMCHEAADEITRLRAERDQLRQYLDAAQRRGEELRAQVAALEVVLTNTRQALERANTTPNGPICDTIWYSDHETLFDYIDAALAERKGEA